jgi:beta-xylosidase
VSRSPWRPDLGDGSYRNPIIHADYSDPDAIRVGDDFFMISSSFNSIPGIPLLHSRDLVNWRIVNHVVKRLGWEGYGLPAHGRGIWAPSIRRRGDLFYVYFASPDEGIFVCRTDDPFGAWSEPECVKPCTGWIDPCPFWDDEGRAYLVNAFANSRIGFKSVLRVSRMNDEGTEVLPEGRFVYEGHDRHPTIEGPKLYKRGEYYYIFAPAGGVPQGWQTVLRSTSIYGPYEDRIVLHQGGTDVNGPHQGAWVELESGQSWFLHFQDRGAYGRVVHLQPMVWEDGWPLIGIDIDGDGIGEPVARYAKPDCGVDCRPEEPACSDDFRSPRLGRQWQWQADPGADWHELLPEAGVLRLRGLPYPDAQSPCLMDLPHVLSQKFPAPAFKVEVPIELLEAQEGDCAGLAVLGSDYAALALRSSARGRELVLISGSVRWDQRGRPIPEERRQSIDILGSAPQGRIRLILRVGEGAVCSFFYRIGSGEESAAGPAFMAAPGPWVGAKFGLFCLSASSASSVRADFSAVTVVGA